MFFEILSQFIERGVNKACITYHVLHIKEYIMLDKPTIY